MNISSRKLIIVLGSLLTLSVAGNFFMGGMLLGKGVSSRPASALSERDIRNDATLREKLSDNDRAAIRGVMQGRKQDFDRLRQDMRRLRAEIARLNDDPGADQAQIDDLLRREQEAKAELMRHIRAAREEMMSKVSPAGKEILDSQKTERLMQTGPRAQRRVPQN